jgi:hypothetical protein
MDFATLFLGAALVLLPLIGAGLVAAMILLERPKADLAPAGAATGQPQPAGRACHRRQRAAGSQRRKAKA